MTSPRTRHPGTLWQSDVPPAIDRNSLVILAGVVWLLLVLIGLVLAFS